MQDMSYFISSSSAVSWRVLSSLCTLYCVGSRIGFECSLCVLERNPVKSLIQIKGTIRVKLVSHLAKGIFGFLRTVIVEQVCIAMSSEFIMLIKTKLGIL